MSGSYCRPIYLQYTKETTEKSHQEKLNFDLKISELKSLVKTIRLDKEHSVVVKFSVDLSFTMINGKVASAILNVSSPQVCNVCLATPTQMNNIEDVCNRRISDLSLLFGLSSLHAYIRFMHT